MNIFYLTYKQIDKTKWDNCIQQASNSLIYGRSYYLDLMAANWDALVLGDYEAVMPLPWKKKWGIRYLYQPAFIQQSGIFYTKKLFTEQVGSFISEAMKKFKFAEITLNFSNEVESGEPFYEVSYRNNFILKLDRSYDELYDNYDPAFTKSLRRIRKFDMQYLSSANYQETIDLYKHLYGKRLPFFSGRDYRQFAEVCSKLSKENDLIVRNAKNTDDELVASVILLKHETRLYNIISCITEKGKKLEANYFLYDNIIHEFANTHLTLDFEGSDVDGIAAFYKKFNPENQAYPHIKYNNLPAFVKAFKK